MIAVDENTDAVALDSESGALDEAAVTLGSTIRGLFLLAGMLGCLVVLAMSSYIRFANADALLFSLMSTQRLTFFYWGQDRLANLVPLLASPVGDERANFYVQMTVMGVSFFVLIMLFAWFHLTAGSDTTTMRSVAGATFAAGLVVIALFEGETGYRFVFEQQYVLTIALFLVGIRFVVSEALGRRLVGGLMVMASVIIIPSSVLLLPFVWALAGTGPKRNRRVLVAVGVAAVSFGVASVAASAFYDGPPQSSLYNDFSLDRMRLGLPVVIENIVASVRLGPTIAIALGAICLLVVRRQHLPNNLRALYASSVVFAAGWLLTFSANGWVEANLFGYRYFFPVYGATIFVITGGIIEGLRMTTALVERSPAAQLIDGGRRKFLVISVLLALVMTWGGHPPAHGRKDSGARSSGGGCASRPTVGRRSCRRRLLARVADGVLCSRRWRRRRWDHLSRRRDQGGS